MRFGGLQKTTLTDFPGEIACIVFTSGCNFRCGYCHNPELFERRKNPGFTEPDFFDFLKTRKNKLDGVVITGGEPTIHKDLPNFIEKIKSENFKVKLDTNGTDPEMLEDLIKANLLDYVAVDIKAPFEKYSEITGVSTDTAKIEKSVKILLSNNIDYEFRTTVVKSQLSADDILKIGKLIKGAKRYYLQKFRATKTLDEKFSNASTYSDEEFSRLCAKLTEYVQTPKFR